MDILCLGGAASPMRRGLKRIVSPLTTAMIFWRRRLPDEKGVETLGGRSRRRIGQSGGAVTMGRRGNHFFPAAVWPIMVKA
jgi:hypothetical protein